MRTEIDLPISSLPSHQVILWQSAWSTTAHEEKSSPPLKSDLGTYEDGNENNRDKANIKTITGSGLLGD